MSRRMIDPSVLVKSQIVDDGFEADLNKILEKYGTILPTNEYGDVKIITLQIYNKIAIDEPQNYINDDNGKKGNVVVNGTITMMKDSEDYVYIQGMILESELSLVFVPFLEIPSGSYENGIKLGNPVEFDIHVIRV